MRHALRSIVGPLVLALGIWCAAGHVALPAVDAGAARLVSLPPWWLLPAALGAAWMLPSCRKEPVLASPALLSLLPWLPLPLPTAALIWTGRLAWVPPALALLAAACRSYPGAGLHESSGRMDRRRTLVLVAGFTALLLVMTIRAIGTRLPGGDEPHYLIITQSLLEDHDLRIENNHRQRDYARYFPGTLDPDFLRRGRNEVIYSIHAPGLSVLIAPLFAVFGYPGAQATVVLCAMAVGVLVWAAAFDGTGSAPAAWTAWLAVAGSVTFLVQGVSIFPDGPAAAVVSFIVWVIVRLERRLVVSRVSIVAASAGLAALPFLHTRLAVVSAGAALAILWALGRETGRSATERRSRMAAFVVLPAIGLAGWLTYFQVLYGTPNPAIAYGDHPETRLAYAPGGILGLLADQDFGLFAFAPILAAAFVGWWPRRDGLGRARAMLPAAGLYLVAVGTYWMWWAGKPATPARFAAALLPVFGPPIAVAWTRAAGAGRTVMASLAAGTLAMSAVTLGVGRGDLAWNTYDAHAPWLRWLSAVADVSRAVPSFFWDLEPGVVTSEWPFVRHTLLAAAAIALVTAGAAWCARRVRVPEAAGAWGVAAALMAIAQVGWWATGATPVQGAEAQAAVLRSLAAGDRIRLLSPGVVFGRSARASDVEIEVPHAGLARATRASWLDLTGIPAGDYTLTLTGRRPLVGALTIEATDDAAPCTASAPVVPLGPGEAGGPGPALVPCTPRAAPMPGQSEVTIRVSLDRPASTLAFEADDRLAAVASRLVLRPVAPR